MSAKIFISNTVFLSYDFLIYLNYLNMFLKITAENQVAD